MITATMTDEQVVARLTLPCTITGLDARCASLEEVYGARLFIRGDGTSW